jgi:hypothetical protein
MPIDPRTTRSPAPILKGKGVSFQHLREFVKKTFGDDAWEMAVGIVDPESRAIMSGDILASAWYPYTAYIDVQRIVVERLMGGDVRRAREIGAYDLEAGLNGVYRAFYRIGTPAFIIRMSALLWRQYFNLGKMVIESSGPGHAIARIEGFVPPYEGCCWDIFGSMVRGLELSGAKSIQADHTACPLKGDSVIRYEARWEA